LIFVTVGSMDPFDRLVRAIDEWAGSRGRTDIFAQIGKAQYEPRHIEAVPFLSPSEFRERIRAARLVVAHAGTGSIIAALELGTPIIVMPKCAHLGEHRNNHQIATARRFGQKHGIIVANDEKELIVKLEQEEEHSRPTVIPSEASPDLISALRSFILETEKGDKANGASYRSIRTRY
jgi:UDP-N-acetylglucosamine transferase subunit ALG13